MTDAKNNRKVSFEQKTGGMDLVESFQAMSQQEKNQFTYHELK